MFSGVDSPAKAILSGNGAGKVRVADLKFWSGLFSVITVDCVRNAMSRIPNRRMIRVVIVFFMTVELIYKSNNVHGRRTFSIGAISTLHMHFTCEVEYRKHDGNVSGEKHRV